MALQYVVCMPVGGKPHCHHQEATEMPWRAVMDGVCPNCDERLSGRSSDGYAQCLCCRYEFLLNDNAATQPPDSAGEG